jgi:hypothetical protein
VGRLTSPLVALALGVLALLTGCANVSAKVTNFNAWPADAGSSSFSFITPENRTGDLEQATYEGYVGAELERQGLTAASPGKAGRFYIDVAATGGTRQKTFLEPIYENNMVFVRPFRDAAGNVFPGYWAPDQFGPRYVGDREVKRTVNVARLKVRILDTTQGAAVRPRPVFDTLAVYEGDNEDLPDVVPYLVRAVFDGFPGANGRVTTVSFNPRTGERLKSR